MGFWNLISPRSYKLKFKFSETGKPNKDDFSQVATISHKNQCLWVSGEEVGSERIPLSM